MHYLCILLILINNVNAIGLTPFVLVIIDTVSDKFVYLTHNSDESEFHGYDINITQFRKRIDYICADYDSTKEWMAEMSIDKNITKERLKSVYACVDGTPDRNTMLLKIMKRVTNRFERNRPKHWRTMPEYNTFNCSDVNGRTIPMPLGVQRCYVQQTRQYRYPDGYTMAKKLEPYVNSEYGTDRKPKEHIFDVECEESFTFKPFRSNNDSKFLGDGECVVRASLMQMSFFCCCYTDYEKCNVANVHDDGLTCPQSLKFKSSVDLKNDIPIESTSYAPMGGNKKRIPADELALVPDCYAKFTVNSEGVGHVIDFDLVVTDKDDDKCKDMFKKRTTTNPCHRYERYCVADVAPEIIYCCHFMASDVIEDGTTLLRVHQQIHKLFEDERVTLSRLGQCLRPYGDYQMTSDNACIFFMDLEAGMFLNLQKGLNIDLSTKDMIEFDKFINTPLGSSKWAGRQFYGRYKLDDARTFGCAAKNEIQDWQNPNITVVPLWYKFTFAVLKCLTFPDDPHRCDDYLNHEDDVIASIPNDVRAKTLLQKYKCNHGSTDKPVVTERNYEAFCMEYVMLAGDENISFLKNEHRNNILAAKNNWLMNADEKTDDTNFFCGITAPGTKKQDQARFCVCTANEETPCNTGDYVRTFNIIAKQEPIRQYTNYALHDGTDRRVCSLPRLENVADTCLNFMEVDTELSCYFLLYEKKSKADIACLREPNLSHRRKDRRMKSRHSWHNYQLCLTVEVPDDPGYRCILKDNTFNGYEEAVIVCCCKSSTCTKAYQELLKRDHFRDTKSFVDASFL